MRQITHDHTFVQSLVDEGRITADEASVHPARSMILRALQGDGNPELDLEMIDVRDGDRILVCSDGLSGVVRDPTRFATRWSPTPDLGAAADALVALALKAGAPTTSPACSPTSSRPTYPPQPTTPPKRSSSARQRRETAPARPERPARRGPGAAMRGLLGSAESRRPRPSRRAGHDDEELRYAPQPPRRYRWLRRRRIVAVVVRP